jgi:MFS family permease
VTASAAAPPATTAPEHAARWRQLAIVSFGLFAVMSPAFAASAVAPALRTAWDLGPLGLPILTVTVLLGFAATALLLALIGAPDVVPGPRLFAIGAVVAGVANLGFAYLATDLATALPFRLLTGAGQAASYPVAILLVTGWFRRDRGLATGVLIGALTFGTASPYLFRAVGLAAGVDWRPVLAGASVACFAGALVVGIWARPGPFEVPSPRFSIQIARRAFLEPSVRLANAGYLGHMWELFAMWTWVPLFFLASFAAAGLHDPAEASLAAFAVVAGGAVGCIVAGAVADRIGRSITTIAAMAISGTCAVLVGLSFGAAWPLVLVLGLVWGVTIIADSAQFSAAVSELAPSGTAGSALTVQLASGFVLTSVSILAIGLLDPTDAAGWRLAFALLAIGPIVGIVSMWRLRGRPDAIRMASGHR